MYRHLMTFTQVQTPSQRKTNLFDVPPLRCLQKINKSEYTLIMKGRPNHFLRQFSSYVQRQANTEQNREAAALLLDRGLSNHIFSRLSAGFNTYPNKMST